jgi:tetratricopeptide (TPR) repeat protein
MLEQGTSRAFFRKLALLKYYKTAQQNYWTHKLTRELHRKWPRNAYIAGMYARQLASLHKPRQAIRVLEGLPNPSPNIQSLMLSYYFRAGQNTKAMNLSNKMRKNNPQLKGVNSLLGVYYFNKKQAKKACQYFEDELALDPNNIVALNNLAWQYGVVGKDYEKARPHLDVLIRRHVLDPRVLDTQGWIYAMNGRLAEADSIIQLSVNLLPDHPTILYHAAFIKARQGKKDQSRAYLEKALGSGMKFEEREDAQKLLQSL